MNINRRLKKIGRDLQEVALEMEVTNWGQINRERDINRRIFEDRKKWGTPVKLRKTKKRKGDRIEIAPDSGFKRDPKVPKKDFTGVLTTNPVEIRNEPEDMSYRAKFKAPSADGSGYFGAFVAWNGKWWNMVPDPKTKVYRTWEEKLPKYFRR